MIVFVENKFLATFKKTVWSSLGDSRTSENHIWPMKLMKQNLTLGYSES